MPDGKMLALFALVAIAAGLIGHSFANGDPISSPPLYGAVGANATMKCPDDKVPFKPRGEDRFATCVDGTAATYIYCVDNILYSTAAYSADRTSESSGSYADAGFATKRSDIGRGALSVSDGAVEARAILAQQCGRFVPSGDEFANALLQPEGERRLHALKEVMLRGSVRKGGAWQWTYAEDRWLVRAHFREDQSGRDESGRELEPEKKPHDGGSTSSPGAPDGGADVHDARTGVELFMYAQMWFCDSGATSSCGNRPPEAVWSGRAYVDNNGAVTIPHGQLQVIDPKGRSLGNGAFLMALQLRPGPLLDGLWYGIDAAGKRSDTPGSVFFVAP
jgi:hypothetical protein